MTLLHLSFKPTRPSYFILVLLLFFSVSQSLSAQNEREKPFMRFRNITDNLGLPGEWARCIYQDSQGLIWFGTDIGFKYFDGYKYYEYPLLQDDVIVHAITEDHKGNIWVAAGANRIYHLDRKSNSVHQYPLVDDIITSRQVYPWRTAFKSTLFEDSNLNLWVGTNEGLMRFNKEIRVFELLEPATKNYTGNFFESKEGEIWEILKNGIRKKGDPENITIPFVDASGHQQIFKAIYNFAIDRYGDLWFTPSGEGIFHFSPTTKSLTQFKNDPTDPGSPNFYFFPDIMADSKNRIWVAADDGGLDLFDRKSNSFFHYQAHFREIDGIATKPVVLFEDRNQGLWVSHYHAGITCSYPTTNNFTAYHAQIDSDNGLGNPYTMGFFERSDGDIWIATDGGGVNLWHREKGDFSHFMHQPLNNNSLSSNKVRQIVEDRQGYVWIRNDGGLDRFNYKRKVFKKYPIKGVLDLSKDGTLWLINQNGLHRYNPDEDSFQLFLPGVGNAFNSAGRKSVY